VQVSRVAAELAARAFLGGQIAAIGLSGLVRIQKVSTSISGEQSARQTGLAHKCAAGEGQKQLIAKKAAVINAD